MDAMYSNGRRFFLSAWLCVLMLGPAGAHAQTLEKVLASTAPPGLTREPGQLRLGQFVELTNDVLAGSGKVKIKVEINEKAFEAKYPDFPVLDIQINVRNIPRGMRLATVLKATLDQLPVPATFSVKGETITIVPGHPMPLKDMSKTSLLTGKLNDAKIKLDGLEEMVTFTELVDFVADKAGVPVYIDVTAFKHDEPDAPTIGEMVIDTKKSPAEMRCKCCARPPTS